MMRRRAVGRSIARAAVGTAVVAGTAGAVHHHQEQKWANQEAQQQAAYDQAYQQGWTVAVSMASASCPLPCCSAPVM